MSEKSTPTSRRDKKQKTPGPSTGNPELDKLLTENPMRYDWLKRDKSGVSKRK